MVKKYSKIVSRQFKKRLGRFIAMIAIVLLGVGFITGLSATAPNMKASVSEYYQKYEAPDIIIKSPSLLFEDDIQNIEDHALVGEVLPLISVDKMVKGKATRIYYRDLSLNAPQSRFELLEGRLPLVAGEILVERSGNYIKSLPLDSNVELEGESYKVVGVVGNPWYFYKEKEVSTVGFGWLEMIIYIDIDSWSFPFYTDAHVRITGSDTFDTFSSDYETKIKKAKEELAALSTNDDWYLLDRQTNIGLVIFEENASKIASIASVFPIFFVVVAGLVVLSTMTRMVEEERMEIGNLKFLGYSNTRITFKYVLYALSATLIGSGLGLLVGFRVLPGIIYSAFSASSHAPSLVWGFYFWSGLIAFVLMATIILLSTLYATYSSLSQTPAELLQPKAPKPGKRILLERIPFIWNLFKFKYKSTIRNIFRYKKNLVMTLIGVAGSTALLFAGFGLRDSLSSLSVVQYEEIMRYDLSVKLRDPNYTTDLAFVSFLEESEGYLVNYSKLGTATFEDKDIPVNLVVFQNEDSAIVNDFINLRERKKGDALSLDEGVIINEGLAILENLKVGDVLTFDKVEYEIAGISENYIENYIFMLDTFYDEEFAPTHIYINGPSVSNNDEDVEYLLSFASVSSYEFMINTKAESAKPLQMMNSLVLIIILAAGALAIIVIYNLTNLNIEERKKEIATLKVLGYTDFETAGYIYREIAILTVIGTAIGLLAGQFLTQYIITLVDGVSIMMGRHTAWYSYVAAAAISLVFTAIVALLMFPKIKKIDMNSSLKVFD